MHGRLPESGDLLLKPELWDLLACTDYFCSMHELSEGQGKPADLVFATLHHVSCLLCSEISVTSACRNR